MENSSTTTTGTGSTEIMEIYNYMNTSLLNSTTILIVIIIIVIYFLLFSSLGNSSDSSGSFSSISQDSSSVSSISNKTSSNILTIIFVGFFIILAIINGLQYFFNINILATISDIFTNKPKIDINIDGSRLAPTVVPEIKLKKQVFNIPGNDYSYPDAKALCSAYGAELATYDQVEDTYRNGGEWCNYGWSNNQMALFPTQQKTWDQLQKIEGHENDCGRPGINGGYMANPALKFGVNCYGYKPRMTEQEENLMATVSPYPKTNKDILMEKRVDYWKDKLATILVSPFNHNTWSKL